MKFYLESNLETIHVFKIIKKIFISSMVQNNMLSTKIRIRQNESNQISSMNSKENVGPQCLSSKDEGVFGKMDGRN